MCHEMSCFVMVRASTARTPPLGSSLPRLSRRQVGAGNLAVVQSSFGWRFRLPDRFDLGVGQVLDSKSLAVPARGMSRCVMKCHVPPRRARLRRLAEAPCACILHVVPSILFRSVHAAAGFPAARPFFARIACARVRAIRAGVRIARLIARASRTPDAPLPSVPNTVMHSLRCPESKRRPRKPPLLAYPYHTTLSSVSSPAGEAGGMRPPFGASMQEDTRGAGPATCQSG